MGTSVDPPGAWGAPPGRIVVTGATGRLGGRVARRLAARGVPLTLLVRDRTRAPVLPGAVVRLGSYGDPDALERALAGASTIFMVSATESPDRVGEHRRFVDAAAEAGVEHLVYTSFYGAGPEATYTLAREHWATEEHIRASGLGYTFLRDNLYADFLPLMVGIDDVLRGPAGEGRAALVAIEDVAESAAVVLAEPGAHLNRTYELTGPEAVTLAQAAAELTRALKRPVTYRTETLAQAYASRSAHRAPAWLLDAWVSTYTAIAAGELEVVTDDVARLTGRPATSLKRVLRR